MPKFLVPITRDVTETATIEVNANSAHDARDIALFQVTRAPHDYQWEPDDGNVGSDPYFAGDDDLEAIEEID